MTAFRTILLDPPWPERGGGKIKRGADRHYPVVTTLSAMQRLIIRAPCWTPADNAHVYMWTTDNYLAWALALFDVMGARMHRTIPWTKPGGMGLGQYFRGCHELLLFGTIGRGKAVCNPGTFRTDALVGAPRPTDDRGRPIHSAKPVEQYALIEGRSRGPYLEMFARSPRDGWTVWGNEV
jgi:N6-adenosine-specific RNA methylase IME4